jgi:hypothetical protein
MPTYDQDGRPTNLVTMTFPAPPKITRVEVKHGEVSFFDGDMEVMCVSRGTYPGAGVAVEVADSVEFVTT